MMKHRQFLAAVVLAAGVVSSPAAVAQQSAYELTLTIDAIDQLAPCSSSRQFGCLGLGDSFSGSFAVDSSILAMDGINQTAAIYDFYLPFGTLVYSTGPLNTALVGFRNLASGAAAPGFVIAGGQVVDWYGGVYGAADTPFIDMNGFQPRNRFYAFDGTTAAYGSLTIASAAPEPQTYAMLMAGLGLVAFVVRRRQRRTSAQSPSADAVPPAQL
jgi:hypothetical protein